MSNEDTQTETNKILFQKTSTKHNINKIESSLIEANLRHWKANLRHLMANLQNLRPFQGLKFGKKKIRLFKTF